MGSELATRSWPRRAFRVAVTCEALLAFGQAVSAGEFLAGHDSMLAFHRTGAVTTAVVALIVTAAALADRRLGRAPVWPVFVGAALFVAEAAQIMVGYYHVLAVHIPLGVSIISSLVLLVAWAWQPPTARQRGPAATPAASGAASLNSSATSAPT